MNPAQKVSTQKVSGHKVSKIDNIGQKVSIQNYLNKDNEHYNFILLYHKQCRRVQSRKKINLVLHKLYILAPF